MQTRTVDFINIGLMIFSACLAMALPFELFLFSYAVLGPLHYITEISWLNDRNFFMKKRRHAIFLVVTCAILTFQSIYPSISHTTLIESLAHILGEDDYPVLIIQLLCGSLMTAAFLIVIVFEKSKDATGFYIWMLAIIFFAMLAQIFLPAQYNFFSIMLPTLIHVAVFTAIFILSGALKQNIPSGYVVFGLYVVTCVAFFIPHFLPIADQVSHYAQQSYLASGFEQINKTLLTLTPYIGEGEPINILQTAYGFNIQAFIAFAYTYHYLNWFSKTSLVGWHRISWMRMTIILFLWLISVGLYLYDYRLGLSVLFFFSLLHVVLEFPLNHKSFVQVTSDIKRRLINKS